MGEVGGGRWRSGHQPRRKYPASDKGLDEMQGVVQAVRSRDKMRKASAVTWGCKYFGFEGCSPGS